MRFQHWSACWELMVFLFSSLIHTLLLPGTVVVGHLKRKKTSLSISFMLIYELKYTVNKGCKRKGPKPSVSCFSCFTLRFSCCLTAVKVKFPLWREALERLTLPGAVKTCIQLD